jgi:hypothetical protein
VILARRHAGVRTKNAHRGHFQTLLEFDPCACGVTVDVRRGWTRVDAEVRDSRRFRFVETHLEAYDDTTSNHTNQGTDVGRGEIREAQAKELIGPGGPTSGKLPVVLALDVNSVKPPPLPGDELAYQAFLDAGWKRRSTNNPASCCIDADVLKVGAGGSISDFDHVIDRILTNAPRRVRLIRSSVTGRQPVNGFWDADHAGVFSTLRVR